MEDRMINSITLYDNFLVDYLQEYFKNFYKIKPDVNMEYLLKYYHPLNNAYSLGNIHTNITTILTKDFKSIIFPIKSLYEVQVRVYRKEIALYFPFRQLINDDMKIRLWKDVNKLLRNLIFSIYKNLARYFLKNIFNLNTRKYGIKFYKVIDDYSYFTTNKSKLSYFYTPFILHSTLNDNDNFDSQREKEENTFRFILFPFSDKLFYEITLDTSTTSIPDDCDVISIKKQMTHFLNTKAIKYFPNRFILGNLFNKLMIVAYDKQTLDIVNSYNIDHTDNGDTQIQIIWNRHNLNNIRGPFKFNIIGRNLKEMNDLEIEWKYYTDMDIVIRELKYK